MQTLNYLRPNNKQFYFLLQYVRDPLSLLLSKHRREKLHIWGPGLRCGCYMTENHQFQQDGPKLSQHFRGCTPLLPLQFLLFVDPPATTWAARRASPPGKGWAVGNTHGTAWWLSFKAGVNEVMDAGKHWANPAEMSSRDCDYLQEVEVLLGATALPVWIHAPKANFSRGINKHLMSWLVQYWSVGCGQRYECCLPPIQQGKVHPRRSQTLIKSSNNSTHPISKPTSKRKYPSTTTSILV